MNKLTQRVSHCFCVNVYSKGARKNIREYIWYDCKQCYLSHDWKPVTCRKNNVCSVLFACLFIRNMDWKKVDIMKRIDLENNFFSRSILFIVSFASLPILKQNMSTNKQRAKPKVGNWAKTTWADKQMPLFIMITWPCNPPWVKVAEETTQQYQLIWSLTGQ